MENNGSLSSFATIGQKHWLKNVSPSAEANGNLRRPKASVSRNAADFPYQMGGFGA